MVKTQIESLLQARFHPVHLTVRDDSAQHAGHAEAKKSGGGHYSVVVVSEQFQGRTRLERHRLIYEALHKDLSGKIHALAIQALTPQERLGHPKD